MPKRYEVLPPAKPASVASASLVPSLPSSSGAVWGTPTTLVGKDRQYVEAHTDFLRAKAAQAAAMTSVVDNQKALALAIARLQSLQEESEHEYRRGRADRAHALAIQAMEHEIAEVELRVSLLAARRQLELAGPPPAASPPPATPAPPPSLSIEDVERVAEAMPELRKGGTFETLIRALRGLLSEKRS